MKKKSFYSFFAVFLAAMLMLAGCFGGKEETAKPADGDSGKKTEETKGPKVLKLNNTEEPGALHPGKAQGTHDSWVLEGTFEGLTKKTPEGKIVDGMAEKWETSEDGLTWTFHLKDGIQWSNGDPVTAGDFEYAWKYALNPKTASDYAYQLYYLKGGTEYNSYQLTKSKDPKKLEKQDKELKGLEDKVGVKATDDKTLVVTLSAPTAYFLDLTNFYTYYPINKKVQEANPKWYTEASSFVSNGAFKLTEWKHKESLKLEKNENYYDKDKIKLDEVDFAVIDNESTAYQMYQNGELDMVYPIPQDVLPTLKDNKEFHNGPDLATYYYNLNNNKKPFTNAKVRKALSMAIDRKAIVESVAQGGQQPAYSVVPPGILENESSDYQKNGGDLFSEDLDQAKKLLAEGLKEEGMSKLPKFSILYNTNEGHKKIAEAVQQMWKKNLGVDVSLENVEFQVKIDREHAGDYQVSRAGWVGDYVDPMTFMDLWVSTGPQNDAKFNNKEYDKLIETAKKSMDNEVRMKAMHDAEKILMDEMPVIPVYFYTKPYILKENVTGFFTPINRYPQYIYADIEK
ncbi:peptide ABC transporter substrate-binding protein [Heyndrickxia sporothermodurans]|uniref:peptide ABC transporter substrate-binding protein n=1 Tax=Heyndrickxia sporothermodurans TaxID=46224 RepID=UPI002DC019FC|nr:peptide ABC transporter substrate-binding protein [Heyndrickxia sporothermodurans]MEB6549162.1 peptide ABC transporter substrate-binding protein [Heyndrickxia sporothermodurans]